MTYDELDLFVDNPVAFGAGSLTRKRCKEAADLVQAPWQMLKQLVNTARSNMAMLKEHHIILEEDLH